MEREMLKRAFILAVSLAAVSAVPGRCRAENQPANALLVVPSETAFNKGFQDFLDKNGAKLLHSYPPSVFIGFIPQTLDERLRSRFGAEVYRERVDDWASFAAYGENAVFAVNTWNKRFVEDPPEAPLVVSARVQKAGRKGAGIKLVWNDVMKATSYRLQISRDPEFSSVELETMVARNRYDVQPFFLPDGVYYWRVAGVMTLNTGAVSEGPFSEAYSFAVSSPARAKGPAFAAPAIERKIRIKGRPLSWPNASGARFYRMQLSDKPDFASPLLDVFTDTCAYKTSGLPIEKGRTYYMRVMGSDGSSAGGWSETSEVVIERSGPVKNDARRRERK